MIKTVKEVASILGCCYTTINIYFGNYRLSKYVLGRNEIEWTNETPRDLLEYLKTKRQKKSSTSKYIKKLEEYIKEIEVNNGN